MTIDARLYDAAGTDRSVEPEAGMARKLDRRQLLWVDLDDRDSANVRRLREYLELPGDLEESLAEAGAQAKLVRYPELIHLRLVAIQEESSQDDKAPEDWKLTTTPIDIVAGANVVATVHDGNVIAFDEFLEQVRGETRLGALDAATFMAALVDSVLGVYLALIETLSRRMDRLDQAALRADDIGRFLSDVVAIRRQTGILRRALAPHRQAFAQLTRPDLDVPELGRPWPGLIERLQQTIDAIENVRDQLIGAFDVLMARSANRTNDVMRALTVINAVLLPAIVLAGIMGMNFQLGFFDQPDNFWWVIGGMLSTALLIAGFARWRGWI